LIQGDAVQGEEGKSTEQVDAFVVIAQGMMLHQVA
jgi:hypothetical protein